jgi:hypothetical protein
MDIIILIYFCIGFIFSLIYSTYCVDDLNNPNNESGMVNIYLLFITFVWPYYLFKYVFELIKK